MAIANVIKTNGNTLNNKISNINSICLNIQKVFYRFQTEEINVRKNYDLLEKYIPQRQSTYEISVIKEIYYVDSINGVDEADSGSSNKPFRTLDYTINQLYQNNIFDNAESIYIYLDNGEYPITEGTFLNGVANKHLYIIGKGKNTTILFNFPSINTSRGVVDFNIHFYRLILSSNVTSGTNYLLVACNLHWKNVLFKDLPQYTYGFLSSHGYKANKSTMQNCIDINTVYGIFRGTNAYIINESIGNYGNFQCMYDCQSGFLNPSTNKITTNLKLDQNYNITDSSINTSIIGLYTGKYSWGNVNSKYILSKKQKIYSAPKINISQSIQKTNVSFLDILKNNSHINIQHLKTNMIAREMYIKEHINLLQNNIIAKEFPIYVKDNTYKYKINPMVKLDIATILIDGKFQDNKVEGNIKGINFIIQKGTYVEIELDFLKDETFIENVSGLPDGLIFVDDKIKGTPINSGDYKLNISMSDDSNIECTLNIPPLIRLL